MDGSTLKLWNANFVFACAANFLMGISFYLLIPTLPFYLVEKFAASKDTIGMVMSCYVIAALLIRPFSGYMVDTLNRKWVYILSFLLFVGLIAGYLVAASVLFIFILRFWHGLTWGVITTAGNTVAIDIIPAEKRGEGIGMYGLSLTLSMAIGPMVGLFLQDHYNFEVIFYASFFIGLVGLLFALFIHVPERLHIIHNALSLDRFLLIKGIPVGINLILISLSYGMLLSFAAMYGKENNVSSTGLFFTLMALGMAVSRFFSGKMIDVGKIRLVTIIGLGTLTFGFLLFTLSSEASLYFIASFFIGLGYGVTSPTFQTMFINLGTHHQRGTASSTFLTAFDIGVGSGMLMAGKIATAFSLTVAFGVSTISCIASILFYIYFTDGYYVNNKLI